MHDHKCPQCGQGYKKIAGRPKISLDVTIKVIGYRRKGWSIEKIAEQVGVSVGAVHRILKEAA